MDIRHLHYYREIVKQGSISKAAEILNIAQPPLSQLLKKLEDELGTTLIFRYRKKWKLTETGHLLYNYAEQVLNQMEAVKQEIHELESGNTGIVRIGVSTACSNILIDFIMKFHTNYPKVKITIFSGNSEEILKKLIQKEIDLAFALKPNRNERFDIKVLKKQPAILIIPKIWANSFTDHPTLEMLAEYPFIMLGAMEGHSFYENIIETFEKNNLKPNITIECKDIAMAVALVIKGLGISIIPQMDYNLPNEDQLAIFKLQQFDLNVEPVMLKIGNHIISNAAFQFWESVD